MALFGFIAAYRNLNRAQQLGVVEQQALALSEERERSDLVARELSHRVENLFSIVQSIISATARQETDVRVAAEKIRERVHAPSRANSMTSSLDMQREEPLDAMIKMIVAAHLNGTNTLSTDGPPITVTAQHLTPPGMILHELTTNAVKNGAWSDDNGRIDITWSIQNTGNGPELALVWQEVCEPATKRGCLGQDGFGSRMINMSMSQLLGTCIRDRKPEGLHVTIILPLDDRGVLRGRNCPAN